ncbi:hypothetical protein [Deinococcus sp.]|uniref:hypothetical protein n=1 Tax=Deinococcus sp. TaxID=47478 RepID=UPI003B59A022
MSALHDALLHPANRPGPLVRRLAGLVNPSADLHGLEDGGGSLCDFRPEYPDTAPSLSVSMGNAGAMFHRFGEDEGGAVAFVASCLHVPQSEAARLLIEWAGLVDSGPTDRTAPTAKANRGAAKSLDRLAKLKPLEVTAGAARLRGWVRLTGEEDGPEVAELARRGLVPALTSGLFTAYRFAGAVNGKAHRLPGHVLPSAPAFEVRGPDGEAWALKVRNPGSKADLAAVKATRYAYLGKGQGTPAWTSPELPSAVTELWVEGELSGVAAAVGLEAAGYLGAVGVQGVAGSEALPHALHLTPGREVYIYADPDDAGDKARNTWAELAAHCGAKVFQLPADLFGAGDACDLLPTMTAAELGQRVMDAVKAAPQWTRPQAAEQRGEEGDVWLSKREGFGVRHGVLCALSMRKNDNGEEYENAEALCNFAAHITAEVTQEDGTNEAARVFELEGTRPDGRPMNPARVTVGAAEFGGMNWPVAKWGAGAVVHAGQGKKDKARAAIQLLSAAAGMAERTVYQHTGWIQHPEHGPVYLTAGAVIGAAGAVDGVDVDLPGRLSAYALPEPGEVEAMRQAVRASLDLLALAPDSVGVPVLGAVYRAVLGPIDAAVWLTGETGRNKTAFMGLAQSHYGPGWSRHYLPDGWNSSANALEKTAFTVKDALFLVDDFKPAGNPSETAKAHAAVARILQGVADGQGRATLTADRKSRAGLWPRGLVMSSSETLPRGHSNRARAVIVDVTRPLIGTDPTMSAAYYAAEDRAAGGVYALALAGYLQTIAAHFGGVKAGSPAHRARVRQLAPRFEGAHGRTGHAAAELAYGWEVFLSFAVKVGAVGEGEAAGLWARAVTALEDTARGQAAHLSAEDPVARALGVLSGLLSQRRVYLEDLRHGGPPPADMALMLGYQQHGHAVSGEAEDYAYRYTSQPGAALVGWYSKAGGDEWGHFLPDALHEALQRAVSGQGGAALPDAGTLWANMRDRFHPAGLMKCETERGGRVRATAKATLPSGERKQLLTLRLPLDLTSYHLGTLGTVGTDGEESTSSTLSNPVPIQLYFLRKVGTVGTAESESSFFAAAPARPSPTSDGEEINGVLVI